MTAQEASLQERLQRLQRIQDLRKQIARLQASDSETSHFLFPVCGPGGTELEEEGQLPPAGSDRPFTRAQARQAAAAAAAASAAAAGGAAPPLPQPFQPAPADPAAPAVDQDAEDSALAQEPDQPDIPNVPLQLQIREYVALDKKDLKELFSAVQSYGLSAPYTISCLESLGGGGAVLPLEWRYIAKTALKNETYFLWEADFLARCRSIAYGNTVLYKQMAGIDPYNTLREQGGLPRSTLASTALAALRAWKSLPRSGSSTEPLSQILQGPEEPYHVFISRLSEAVERILGVPATNSDNTLVKQLAFENANETCKSILRNNFKGKSLHDMINVCREADPFVHKITKALVTFQGQSRGKTCFQCGAPGHFASCCPRRKAPALQVGSATPRPPLCTRCHRGRHWSTACRSTHDVEGNPLPPRQGNGRRGQPRAPQPIAFQPASGSSRYTQIPPNAGNYHFQGPQPQFTALSQVTPQDTQPLVTRDMPPPQQPPLSGPPQGAQAWTCVPPPPEY